MKNSICARLASAVVVFLVSLGVAAPDAASAISLDQQATFDIPAQPLPSALVAFSRQAGVQVVTATKDLEGFQSGEVKGRLALRAAMTRLLGNTGLAYKVAGDSTVVVGRAESLSAVGDVEGAAGRSNSALMLAQAPSERTVERTAQSPSEAGSDRGIHKAESIMVTARKREERLIDVPSSIAVITADDIDRRGLVHAEDYLRGIPGANQMDTFQGQAIILRGIETSVSNQTFTAGTTVATYFGETPTTNSAGLAGGSNVDLKLVDIERVEVLRGPQGTAFGNSSMGGAVRTIPVAPKLDRFEGKAAVGYSLTSGTGGDNYSLQAVGNFPLIKDQFAIRAVAYQFQDSGFYRSRARSDPAFQTAVVNPYGAQASAVDEEEVGSYYVTGGRIAALFRPNNDLGLTLSFLSQKSERDGIALANSGRYEQTLLRVAAEHAAGGRTGGFADSKIDLMNAVIEYNLGWANLLATYSYIKSEWRQASPFGSFGGQYPVSYTGPTPHREHVGEIRLATQLHGAWDFLAGLYGEQLKDDVHYNYVWHGDPATNFFPAIFPRGQSLIALYNDRRNLKQKAVFGEASWEFLPALTLTGGARGYEYDRTIRVDADGAFYGAAGLHSTDNAKASGATFRGNLSYKLGDRGLVYAGWSQGFRLGRPQQGLPVCDRDGDGILDGTSIAVASTREVNSDEVDSYEVGGKFMLFNRRLTIAADAFRMEWSDVPVRVVAGTVAGGCGLGYVANAGEALSEGVELQANFQLTPALRVDFGGSWIHARLVRDVPALNARRGNRLPGSPKANANLGLQYDFKVAGYRAFVRADSIYVSSFYGDFQQSAQTRAGGYVKVDASTGVQVGKLNFELFGRNLTNSDEFTWRDITGRGEFFGYRLRPRTIGFRLGYIF